MPEWTGFIEPLLGALTGAVAAYVAIRADLAAQKATLEHVKKTADDAHFRIDGILMQDRRSHARHEGA